MSLIPSDFFKTLRQRRTLIAGSVFLLCLAFLPLVGGHTPAGILWSIGEQSNPNFVEQVYRVSRQAFSILGNRNPVKLQAQYALGRLLFRQHRYLESINCLAEIANSNGDTILDLQTRLDLRYFLACDYWYNKDYSMSAQRFAEASELATKAGKSLKYKIEISKWRIKALLRSAQWNEADAVVAEIKSLVSQSGTRSRSIEEELSSLFDEVLKSESRYDELDENLKQIDSSSATIGPSSKLSIGTERKLGWICIRRHHYDEALQHFNTILKQLPEDGYALWNRGICYDLLGKNELAIEDYAKYLTTAEYRSGVDNYRKREVVGFKKYCVNDYFAAEAGRALWGRWPKRLLPLKVYVSEGTSHGFNALTKNEIIKCLNRWRAVLSDSLNYILVDSQEKAQLVFARVESGYELTDRGNYDGMTYISTDRDGGWGPYQFDFVKIKLADIDMRTVSPEKIQFFHTLLLHEIGHALGLRTHSPNAGDIMFQSAMNVDLSPRDIATIRLIYAEDASAKAKAVVNSLAADGCAYAQYTKGVYCREKDNDYQRALEQFQLAYNQHLPEAATAIGSMYMSGGPNFPQNYEKSLHWFERAVLSGDNSANIRIGDLYQFGYGVKSLPIKAVTYYQKAAESGNKVAQRKLGLAYQRGSGVEKDDFQAFQWFKKAALQNDGEAQQRLAYAFHYGLGTRKDDNEAFAWYSEAAANRVAVAESWLGYFYEHGVACPVNMSRAQYWYQRAAADGDKYAGTALRKLDLH